MRLRSTLASGIVTLALAACSTDPPTSARCIAAYAPTEPTLLLRYRRTGTGIGVSDMTVAERLEVEESTERVVRLRFGEGTSARATLVRSCSPLGLADPYIGWLATPGWEQEVQGLLPVELHAGVSWESSVRLSWPGMPSVHADARRSYSAEIEERVTVPAGAFDTWRIAFREEAGADSAQGNLWLARDVGLVRMEMRSQHADAHASVVEELITVEHIQL